MKTFVYTATDVQGNTVRNVKMSAEDVNDFLNKIHEKGLFCSSYRETNSKTGNSLHKFKTKELAYNCRQLSAMLSSGLTLVKALDIQYKEQPNEASTQIFKEIYEEVQKGQAFSEALKKQQGAFPNFFISMVEAGEASGSMDIVMKRMETHYANENKMNHKIKSAITYPIILSILCIAVIILMFAFILPTFKDLMTPETTPPITKALFAFSDSLIGYWYIYILVILAIVFGIHFALKVPTVLFKFDKFKCKGPAVGKLMVKIYTGRFARTLSSLYSSGIPMVESLERSAAILNNTYIQKEFETVVTEVKSGEQLSVSITRTGVFESMFCSMIFVGEESGALDSILEKSADFYEEESDSAVQSLVGILEPVLIIIMGVAIGFVMAGVFPALYSSFNNIK